LCRKPQYDILKHVVLKALRAIPTTVLLIEGFCEDITNDVPTLKRKIRRERYKELLACLQSDNFVCQYQRHRGNLTMLRTLKLVVHASRCAYPHDASVRNMDEQLQFFDIRKDLRMQDPFVPWTTLGTPFQIIRQSLLRPS
jgi:hypothetical protein